MIGLGWQALFIFAGSRVGKLPIQRILTLGGRRVLGFAILKETSARGEIESASGFFGWSLPCLVVQLANSALLPTLRRCRIHAGGLAVGFPLLGASRPGSLDSVEGLTQSSHAPSRKAGCASALLSFQACL